MLTAKFDSQGIGNAALSFSMATKREAAVEVPPEQEISALISQLPEGKVRTPEEFTIPRSLTIVSSNARVATVADVKA